MRLVCAVISLTGDGFNIHLIFKTILSLVTSRHCIQLKLSHVTFNVKFASGIKSINLGFYPYIDVCLYCILSTLPSSVKKIYI